LDACTLNGALHLGDRLRSNDAAPQLVISDGLKGEIRALRQVRLRPLEKATSGPALLWRHFFNLEFL
jgi:hypothetical protein